MRNLTIERLARNIGRESRFGGDTGKYWWSVLHHSFLAEAIVFKMMEHEHAGRRDEVRLWALAHDLHEGETKDIKTPDKTDAMRQKQQEIDALIWREIGVQPPDDEAKAIIKEADHRCCAIEAVCLQDPYLMETEWYQRLKGRAVKSDRQEFEMIQSQYGSPTLTTSPHSRGVTDYIEHMRSLAAAVNRVQVYALDRRDVTPQEIAIKLSLPVTLVQTILSQRQRRNARKLAA